MKSKFNLSLSILALVTGLFFSFCTGKATKQQPAPATDNGIAVIELFTSEGCSSCPPADEAMIRLSKEFADHVYFLGYHVDYWDYIGWKDKFADADFTARQRKYAGLFGLNSIYTPQAVVNGERELVGSKEGQLRNIIREELGNQPSSTVAMTATMTNANGASVTCKVNNAGKSTLNIALVQLSATTDVKRGENSGHKLNHINIVRTLKNIPVDKEASLTVEIKIPPGLSSKDVKLIAFVQDKNSLKISGAAEALIK
jgi:hypothetical protein